MKARILFQYMLLWPQKYWQGIEDVLDCWGWYRLVKWPQWLWCWLWLWLLLLPCHQGLPHNSYVNYLPWQLPTEEILGRSSWWLHNSIFVMARFCSNMCKGWDWLSTQWISPCHNWKTIVFEVSLPSWHATGISPGVPNHLEIATQLLQKHFLNNHIDPLYHNILHHSLHQECQEVPSAHDPRATLTILFSEIYQAQQSLGLQPLYCGQLTPLLVATQNQ